MKRKKDKPKFPLELMEIHIPVQAGASLDKGAMEELARQAANQRSATPVESLEFARTEPSAFSENMTDLVYLAWGTRKEDDHGEDAQAADQGD